jgi:ubiquitin-protein ligase
VQNYFLVNSNSVTDERKTLKNLFEVILSNGFPRLRICTAAGIESLDESETWTGSPSLRILILDVRTPVAYEKLGSVCPNLRQFKSHSLSLSLSLPNFNGRSKRLLTEIIRLKQLESEKKFILEDCSFYDTDKSSTSSNNEKPPQYICKTNMPVILGRILPEKDPYCFASFRIKIILPPEYPFKVPEATILDPIYHPNVRESGKHCCGWGFTCGAWRPGIMLVGFIAGMVLKLSIILI